MNARQRSLLLIPRSAREGKADFGLPLDTDEDIDPFEILVAPEPDHRNSLDAMMHEVGREYLPSDSFSFRRW